MPIDISLLSCICEAAGAPGYEKMIRELVIKKLKGLADDVRTDNIGNVIALKKRPLIEKEMHRRRSHG